LTWADAALGHAVGHYRSLRAARQGGDPRLPPAGAGQGNRTRAAADWLLNAVLERQTVQLGLIRAPAVPLEAAAPGRATARA
jgi:hypothetical protein